MRLKCIACEVLARPVYLAAAQAPHPVDVELIPYGLHQTPAELRAHLQARVDAADPQGYPTIALGYGLCGKALAGLQARTTPLVLPRAHDCITLFLGSRARYTEQFNACPGTYWYTQDYLERQTDGPLSLGAATLADLETLRAEYVQKYGADNADYLLEVMGAWQKYYQRAVYIDLSIGPEAAAASQVQAEAAQRGWTFERLAGDLGLIRRLLAGDQTPDFLVVPPGAQISMTLDEQILAWTYAR